MESCRTVAALNAEAMNDEAKSAKFTELFLSGLSNRLASPAPRLDVRMAAPRGGVF